MAPRTDFSVVGETYDVALGACPITDLSSKYSPTAKEIKKFVFHKRWHKVELYSHQHADDSYDDDDTVHLHHRGLTMKHPLVFVDMNDDDYAQRHVERLEELEELDDGKCGLSCLTVSDHHGVQKVGLISVTRLRLPRSSDVLGLAVSLTILSCFSPLIWLFVDWTAWVKDGAIPNMVKDEILYTDGLMDHWIGEYAMQVWDEDT